MREGRLTRERDPVESPWVEPEMGKGKVCVLSGIEVMGRCNNNNRNRENRGIEKQRKQGNDEEGVGRQESECMGTERKE